MIPLNFSMYTTHLWYIYMLIGLYLYLPILSAWLQQASENIPRSSPTLRKSNWNSSSSTAHPRL